MLRLLTALLAGLFLAGLGLEMFTDAPGVTWVWPVLLPILIIALMLLGVGKGMRGMAKSLKSDEVRTLLDQNLGAIARITSIKRTGTVVNDAPVCELGLVVAPFDRGAYAATTRLLLDPVALARFQPGTVVTVVRLKADRPEVSLVREPDAEWQRRMTDEAHRIPHSAAVWEADPAQAPGFKPIIGTGAKGRGLRISGYLALFAVGVAVMLVPNHSWVALAVEHVRVGDDFDDYVNGDRQSAAVDALAEVIGGTQVTEVSFHADGDDSDGSVYANAPTSPGAATIDTYMFRDNEATRHDVTPTQPEDPKKLLFDIAEVDLSQLKKLAAQTRELTGITEPDSELARIAREAPIGETPIGEAKESGPVLINVSVQNRYYSGSVVFTLDGEVFRMSGGTPESEASKSAADAD